MKNEKSSILLHPSQKLFYPRSKKQQNKFNMGNICGGSGKGRGRGNGSGSGRGRGRGHGKH